MKLMVGLFMAVDHDSTGYGVGQILGLIVLVGLVVVALRTAIQRRRQRPPSDR